MVSLYVGSCTVYSCSYASNICLLYVKSFNCIMNTVRNLLITCLYNNIWTRTIYGFQTVCHGLLSLSSSTLLASPKPQTLLKFQVIYLLCFWNFESVLGFLGIPNWSKTVIFTYICSTKISKCIPVVLHQNSYWNSAWWLTNSHCLCTLIIYWLAKIRCVQTQYRWMIGN